MTGRSRSDDARLLTTRGAILRWLIVAVGVLVLAIGVLAAATEGLLAGLPGIVLGGAGFLVGVAAGRVALERYFPIALAGLIIAIMRASWSNTALRDYGIPWETVMDWSSALSLASFLSVGALTLGLALHDWKANRPNAALAGRGGLTVAAGLVGIAALYGVVIAVVVDQQSWGFTVFFALVVCFNLMFAWDVARGRRFARFLAYVLLANMFFLAMGANQGIVIGPNSELGKDWWMDATGVVLSGLRAVGLFAVTVMVLWDPTKTTEDREDLQREPSSASG